MKKFTILATAAMTMSLVTVGLTLTWPRTIGISILVRVVKNRPVITVLLTVAETSRPLN